MKIYDFAINFLNIKFLKYLVIGIIAFSFEVTLFYFFTEVFSIVTANVFSRMISLVLHFLLIRNFIFFRATKPLISFFQYILLSFFNSFISGIFIYLSFSFLYDLNLIIYKILFDLILMALNFLILKVYIFK
tara:strand:+ start:289 stop:684 length:396 start_codon:yes stop_codon:yes gene_type:complete